MRTKYQYLFPFAVITAVTALGALLLYSNANNNNGVLSFEESASWLNKADISRSGFAMQGQPIPPFSLTSLEGNQPLNASIFLGSWSLLNVWASWCSSCKSEHDYLRQLAQQQKVRIIGLNYRDKRYLAQGVLDKTGNPYFTVIFDPKGSLALDLGSIVTPETYLIDSQGVIRFRHSGALNDDIWQSQFMPRITAIQGTIQGTIKTPSSERSRATMKKVES